MNKFSKGQSIFEVLIALGVFVIAITAAFQIFFGGQKLTIDSQNYNLATDYGRQGVEALRNIRARNWNELTDGSHGLLFQNNQWMFGSSSTSDAKDIFTRTVSVATIDANTKIATTTITWDSGSAVTQKVEIVERLTHWEVGSTPQNTCNTDPLSGNWANPHVVGTGDIGSGNEGTDIVVRYPYAYVSGTAASASKPDIFIFDVSNPAAPSLVGSLDFGAGGINAIALKGNFIYGASPNDTKELVIIDVSNPAAPSLTGSLDLAGSTDASAVAVFGNTVAIGRLGAAANQLVFIDVTTPSSPTIISQTNTGGAVHKFTVDGNSLYIAEEKDTADIRIYDISDTANPTYVTTYDTAGVKENWSIYAHEKGGTNLLVGNDLSELEEIGATTTNLYVRSKLAIGGKVDSITCSTGDLAFLATENSNQELTIVNISNPDSISQYSVLNLPQVGTGAYFASNTLYMSLRSNNSLQIIQSQ